MVVDDDLEAAQVLARAFESRGHRATVAPNAHAAFEMMLAGIPDVALVAASLPTMSGYALCERLRARPELAALRLVMIGSGRSQSWSHSLGIEAHVTRPVEIATLLALVERPRESGARAMRTAREER
jgi:CheY-like chemotaxis protein